MKQSIQAYSADKAARYLSEGQIGAFALGRAEVGPRALGNRSILADARSCSAKDRINGLIKHRQAFQPLAPICLADDFDEYFERPKSEVSLAFMLYALKCRPAAKRAVPAIVHADGTARVQLVDQRYPFLHELLVSYRERTGIGILINTSLNGKGEPIVNTAVQAYRAYRCLDLDFLVVDSHLVRRAL
jgi:predicted NodU family carbamoyl transferase